MAHLSHQSQGTPSQQLSVPVPARHLDLDLHPQGHGTPLGQGTPSQQILDPLGPEYTHRAKVHLLSKFST